MQLTVHDAAQLLKVSEKTVYRWIQQRQLPAYRLNEQYRFNRAEILEWATAQRVNVSPAIFEEPDNGGHEVSLVAALEEGGIFYRISGKDRESVLKSVVGMMKLPDETSREFLWKVLLAREELASTAVGDGIAIPHVRQPIVLHVDKPTLTLCFLENPVDFKSLDEQPVNVLFTIVTPTVKSHLRLLARLAYALRNERFKSAILKQRAREEIIDEAGRLDAGLAGHAAGGGI